MKASKITKLVSVESYIENFITYNVCLFNWSSNKCSLNNTRRTFPGCVTSFKGFPFEGAGDDSGTNYISCIAYNIRNSNDPWKVLKKKNKALLRKL